MNKNKDIVKKHGKSFCVLPFIHMHICDTGVCKVCCGTKSINDTSGNPLSVYTKELMEIFNSKEIRDIRKAMVNEEVVDKCSIFCGSIERTGGISRRFRENQRWEKGQIGKDDLSLKDLKNIAKKYDFFVEWSPFYIDLELDNKCNYACRMCDSDRSSRIERDHIQNQWGRRLYHLGMWQDGVLSLAPRMIAQGEYIGFNKNGIFLQYNGTASIFLPHLCSTLDYIKFILRRPLISEGLRVTLNGQEIAVVLPDNELKTEFIILLGGYYPDFRVEFECIPLLENNEGNILNIDFSNITLHSNDKLANEIASSRFSNKQHWVNEDDFIQGEVLAKSQQVQIVKLIGGEPLINPATAKIVNHLLSCGDPQKTLLTFVSNCSVYNEKILGKAKDFKRMVVAASIDSIGLSQEYIRYGAKWDVVENNIFRMKSEGVFVIISSTLQAYNALEFCSVLEYCDSNTFNNYTNFIDDPKYCSINVLPPAVRAVAAERLLEYSKKGTKLSGQAAMFANSIKSNLANFDPADLREFMIFTNDLDRSRGQNIKETFPELVHLIEEAGYPWINETRYWK